MALNYATLCAGDQGNGVAHRPAHGDLGQAALALAMVSGDSFLVGRPELVYPGPPQAVRLSARTHGRRMPGVRNRRRFGAIRFSPYTIPRVLRLLGSVLRQPLMAFGGVSTRISA
uniref:Chromosome 11 open reading frame 71 n=1 Tax=Chinchilla lanigera TaxID=34839 RepID=A0A8C2YT19_CHILA